MDFLTGINLMIVFGVIAAVGFLFLISSLVVGDIFEAIGFDIDGADSGEFGFLDSRVIAVFMTAFGGFGIIAVQMGYGPLAGSIAGLLGGVVFGGIVSAFGRFLVSQQASSSVTDNDLIGRTAQVTVSIKPGEIGMISAVVGEERVEKIARTMKDNEIKPGTLVKISAIAGDSVIVEIE